MSRIRRIAPGLGRGGLLGNTEGPEAYLRELDTLPSQFCRATGGTETVISQGGKFYRVHTFTDTDPTSLLLNFDGSNGSTTFTDDSGWGHAVTANGDAQISTTQSKFGGSSAYFDGNGDYLSVPDSPLFEFGSGDFTIEGWFYIAGNSPQDAAGDRVANFVSKYPASGSVNGFELSVLGDGTTTGTGVVFNCFNNTASVFSASYSGTVTQSVWHHIAVCRNGSSLYLFLDGSQVKLQSGISGSVPDTSYSLLIGKSAYATYERPLNGYIDSLRIVKGQALYTSAFTPPTTALTRVGSGSLTFTRGGAVEYLVVGGGGGGGQRVAGGGGAGGLLTGVAAVATGTVTASVGDGGAGSSSDSLAGSNGSNSSAFSQTAVGGGGGGTYVNAAGQSGGSGGGGSGQTTLSGGTGTAGQGNDGGDGDVIVGDQYAAGGGGGAGSAGANGVSATSGGDGGNGVASDISGSSVVYAGGGGGAGLDLNNDNQPTTAGSGGTGGGGDGGFAKQNNYAGATSAQPGTNGLGGGGGGGSFNGSGMPGGSGGSGIVIARYRITQAEYEAEAA